MAKIGAKLLNWWLNKYYKRKFNDLGGPNIYAGSNGVEFELIAP